MSSKAPALKPQDIVVALRLAIGPNATYPTLAKDLSISQSTAHESVERLQLAGLLRPDSRHVIRHALLEFLEHGVRYAFPASPQSRTRGVATAYSAPAFVGEIVADDVIVWPDPRGAVVGQAIAPLLDQAALLPEKCPKVYDLLTLVDAIRIGRVRERAGALKRIRERLSPAA